MLPPSSSSNRKQIWTLLALFMLIVLALPALAGDKKKKGATPEAQLPKRVNFDISKIIWPNPPAITRIRYLAQFTGEKIDFNTVVNGKQKVKQGWMDRLAGTKPQADQNLKLPFQLVRTYGVAFDSKGRIY